MTEKQVAYIKESLCINIAVCFGVAIYLAFNIPHGYWIPMTVALMFMASNQGQGAIVKKTLDRVIGTFTGALFGFLYVDIFMYANYHWAYLLPLIWVIGYYCYFVTNNYAIIAMTITMYVPILFAITTVEPISIGATLFQRLALTILGATIALVAEYVIYKEAASSAPELKRNTTDFFCSLGEIIERVSSCFLGLRELDEEFRKTLWNNISNIASMENLYLNIKYEFDYKEKQEAFYQYLFMHIARIGRSTRKIIGIAGHDRYDNSVSNLEELKEISAMVSSKYKNMIEYFNGRTDDSTEKLEIILSRLKTEDKFSSAYLYLEEMYEFSKLADALASAVYQKNFVMKD